MLLLKYEMQKWAEQRYLVKARKKQKRRDSSYF